MDNNQNMGQPINPQVDYTQQPQMDYTQQSQMDYTQQPQMQQGYAQPQMQYQNMQQGYTQQPQMQYGYGQPMNKGPKKPVNKKALAIVAAIAVVALLIIFIPKIFKPDTPFDKVKLGMTTKKVMDIYNLTEDDYGMFGDTLYTDEKGFGVEGRLQLCLDFSEVKLDHVNWYVDRDDCESDDAYEEAIKDIKKYYTRICGKPDKDGDELVWEDDDLRYELDLGDDDEFILRMKEN